MFTYKCSVAELGQGEAVDISSARKTSLSEDDLGQMFSKPRILSERNEGTVSRVWIKA